MNDSENIIAAEHFIGMLSMDTVIRVLNLFSFMDIQPCAELYATLRPDTLLFFTCNR